MKHANESINVKNNFYILFRLNHIATSDFKSFFLNCTKFDKFLSVSDLATAKFFFGGKFTRNDTQKLLISVQLINTRYGFGVCVSWIYTLFTNLTEEGTKLDANKNSLIANVVITKRTIRTFMLKKKEENYQRKLLFRHYVEIIGDQKKKISMLATFKSDTFAN